MIKIRQYQAFTLLELLIAISLSTMVMIVLIGGFFMVTKNWEAQEQVIDNEIDNALIRLEIEKAILGAFPYTYMENKNKIRVFFKGEEQAVSFVSTMSPAYNNQLTIWVIKALVDGGLSIQVTSALTDDPDKIITKLTSSKQTKNEPTLVLQDYQAIFEYLFETRAGEKRWVKNWNGNERQSLPLAVHIILTLMDKEQKYGDKKPDEILAFILANEHQTIKPKHRKN
ncbi:MAG: prepilin-type N-terminal cleavage/methylation domain-containing protein [Pseudomonadota bacterium]